MPFDRLHVNVTNVEISTDWKTRSCFLSVDDNTPNVNIEQICKALFFYCFLFQGARKSIASVHPEIQWEDVKS